MLLPVRPICNRKKIRKDGTSLIQIQYCYSADKKTLLGTDLYIPPIFWNKKSTCISDKLPSQFGDSEKLNIKLKQMLRIAEDIIAFAIEKKIEPVEFVRKTFSPDYDLNQLAKNKPGEKILFQNLDIYYQIDQYIESKRKSVTPKMINVYRNMKDTLIAFQLFRKEPITFESFDFSFYEEFVHYMRFEHVHRRRKSKLKGFKTNTIGKTIRQLRIFLGNRMRRKIIPTINLEDFKILDENADAVYLSWAEIRQIFQKNLSATPQLEKYRDLFVFGCLTGLRYSDFSTISPDDVRNKMLYKKQEKSDHWVVIPLRNEAYDIFVNRFKRQIPKISNAGFNYYIKEVAQKSGIVEPIKFSHKKGNRDIIEIKPKYAWVTSHTCRRSFCTNEFLAGTPVELIMKISGHKSIRDFYRYIRITPEEAGNKIKELWTVRNEMSLVRNEE